MNVRTSAVQGGEPHTRARLRRALVWTLGVALVVVWFAAFRPTQLGGPLTLATVKGTSMQPGLVTGDLVVARRATDYAVGDVVVYTLDDGTQSGRVVHRILGGDAATGWTTQGDNRTEADRWVVTDDAVLGQVWFSVPGAGGAVEWVVRNPLRAGLVVALFTGLTFVPRHRRRVVPELREALAHAEREPRGQGRDRGEALVLALSGLATAATASLVVFLYAIGTAGAPAWVVAFLALAVAAFVTVALAHHYFDGAGVAEPSRSTCALSGRLRLVDHLPEVDHEAPVRSAVELRSLADRYRLPVLHHVDPASGLDEFLLLTEEQGAFAWRPPVDERHLHDA